MRRLAFTACKLSTAAASAVAVVTHVACRTTLVGLQRFAIQFSSEMMKNHDLIMSIEMPLILIFGSNFVPMHAIASSERVVAIKRKFKMAVAAILDL